MLKLPRNVRKSVRAGHKWKKGESGKSNPDMKKHREAARKGEFHIGTQSASGSSQFMLTQAAMERLHLQNQDDPDEDCRSVNSVDTFRSWATNLTNCSNPVFNRVLSHWTANSGQQEVVLSVLAGLNKVIQEKGGQESSTEYFAVLLNSMELLEDVESQAAKAYLLRLVMIKAVPEAVLRTMFSKTAKILVDALNKCITSDVEHPTLGNSLLLCLGHLLRVQNKETWRYPSTLEMYRCLLHFIIHPKPRLRHASHQAICSVLRGPLWLCLSGGVFHPACKDTEKYITALMKDVLANMGEKTTNHLLYALDLVGECLAFLPAANVERLSEVMLSVMKLSQRKLRVKVMEVFQQFFKGQPPLTVLPMELNGRLLTALGDEKPDLKVVDSVRVWLEMMRAGVSTLETRTKEGFGVGEHLEKLFGLVLQCVTSLSEEVRKMAMHAGAKLISENLNSRLAKMKSETVHKMYKSLRACLSSLDYSEALPQVLHIITAFIRVWHTAGSEAIGETLQQLVPIRDEFSTTLADDIDRVFGVAIETLGTRLVLDVVPLRISDDLDDKCEFKRSWLLPLLRDHCNNSEVGYFATYFLPLADQVAKRADQLQASNRLLESNLCATLVQQLWSTLPGFCSSPVDMAVLEEPRGLLEVLERRLDTDPTLRSVIMAALRQLITSNMENDDNLRIMKLKSKLFIPRLLSLYEKAVTEPDTKQLQQNIRVTLNVYLPIIEPNKIRGTIKILRNTLSMKKEEKKKIDLSKMEESKRLAHLDLLAMMVPYFNKEDFADVLYNTEDLLKEKDVHLQKKAYRILEEVCKCSSETTEQYLREHTFDIWETLDRTSKEVRPPSKKSRLHCYLILLRRIQESNNELINKLLPQTLTSLKEINSQTRTMARNLLVEMVLTLNRWRQQNLRESGEGDPDVAENEDQLAECLGEFMKKLCHMLKDADADVTVKGVTAEAVACLFQSPLLSHVVKSEHVTQAIDAATRLVCSSIRELANQGVFLARHLVRYAGDLAYLDKIVEPLISINPTFKRPLRFEVKAILGKLMKKFGLKNVQAVVPQEYHKMMVNSYKRQLHQEKKNSNHNDDAENDQGDVPPKTHVKSVDELLQDSDDEMEVEVEEKKKQRRADMDDFEVLDLNEPVSLVRTLARDTAVGRKRKAVEAFPTKNGKLLIMDEEGEEDDIRAVDDDDIDDEDNKTTPAKKTKKGYEPGGKGIHRAAKAPGAEYRSKKAAGDMKKHGRPDPYACLPLGQTDKKAMKKVMKSVQKGAAKGKKARALAMKREKKRR